MVKPQRIQGQKGKFRGRSRSSGSTLEIHTKYISRKTVICFELQKRSKIYTAVHISKQAKIRLRKWCGGRDHMVGAKDHVDFVRSLDKPTAHTT